MYDLGAALSQESIGVSYEPDADVFVATDAAGPEEGYAGGGRLLFFSFLDL